MSIPLTDFVKSAPTFSGKSFGKNSSKEIGVDSLIETGKCDLLIQNKDNNLKRVIYIFVFYLIINMPYIWTKNAAVCHFSFFKPLFGLFQSVARSTAPDPLKHWTALWYI